MASNAAILGRVGIYPEPTASPGEVLVLAVTPVSSLPASLTTALSAISGAPAYVGWRLLIVVTGNSATGTISVAGKDFSQAQNAVSETTPTIPVAGSASNPLTSGYEYVTTMIFSSINANGVTVSGLTGGSVKIYAVLGARWLVPCMFDAEEKIPEYSPQEQRGLRSRHSNIIRLNKQVDLTSLKMLFYPDVCNAWLPRSVIGSSPSQATIPASPTVLKSTYAVAGGATSLTTQPNTLGPGSLIQLVVTGSSAVGTVVIAGTNIYGQAITETVQCGAPGAANGNGTYYTQQVFATVNASGISFTALTSGSVAFNGIILSQETYIRDKAGAGDTYQSLVVEQYTGADALVFPFAYPTETTIEWNAEKETTVTLKGGAQDSLAIGNRATTPLASSAINYNTQIGAAGAFAGSSGGNPAAGLWQPFDIGLAGWQVAAFIDALSGTPGTTAYNQILQGKIIFKTPQKPSYPSVNWQRFQKLYGQQDETQLDLTVDFIDEVQYEQFRQNIKQLIQVQFIGPYAGATGGTAYYKNWTFTFAAKLITAKRDPSKMEKVEATITYLCEWTQNAFGAGVNGEYQLVVQSQLPPNYAA